MIGQRLVRGARLLLSAAFAVLAVSVLAVGLAARVGPAVGYELFSIRSGSMAPAMPVGTLAVVSTGTRESVDIGEPVAFRLPNGAVVTHRMVELVGGEDEPYLRTKGDANEDPDPSLVPESALIGPVVFHLPLVGFMLAMLGMPIGIVTILSVAGTLLTAIWLLEELEQLDAPETSPAPAPTLAGGQ